ncbi:RNA polymerase sigma-70 factor [Chitinophaga agrisoli]|uniref:RNA polymerase sigma-70 factor n=1 Tax=Chitinophaga agrisoli TaxID=2607653 RepID=A0A5B2VTT7_9BACT|nr:RNA polymerase sigma-70 factor [Chitinophaga agrisoli]KAA2241677.1 RNA polymerase sigma-70 factor [Chitinophaga agrisoli]
MLADNPSYNEKELLLRIADDDTRAFARLMGHYSSMVYGYLLRYVKDPCVAQELAQDVFLKIWHHRKRLGGIANFPGYLYVALRNTAANTLKEKLLKTDGPPTDAIVSLLAAPASKLEYEELANTLSKAIDQLPPRRKEIFKLNRFEGLTYEEIAQRLNIAKSTVKEHMTESLQFLREHLKEELDTAMMP